MVTADAFFLAFNVNNKRGGIRVCIDDHEGSNGFALQLVVPIVVGRVYVVANLDVRIAGCGPMVEVTFVTLLRLTQGLDYDGDLPAQAGPELAFASRGDPSLSVPLLDSGVPGSRLRTVRLEIRLGITSSNGATPVDRCGWL